ncbi:MAG: NADH-quinone oxidoreductase subunit M, partial [Chloroflexota bacterium]
MNGLAQLVAGLPILSMITLLPFAGALLLALLPSTRPSLIRGAALTVSLTTFVLSLLMLPGIRNFSSEFAFSEQASWIPSFGITYHLGVDGLSGALVVLTTLLS